MSLGEVVDYFIREYNLALNNEHIHKPIAYALYQTWKWVDDKEKTRVKEGDADASRN